MEKILELINVEKYYGSKGNITKALDKVSFEVEKGELISIMGASGSGKTTLLNCIYLCRKLCKKLGHVISVESAVGEYTKVRISFGKNEFYSDVT